MKKKILILCGGRSPEHLISLRSAKNVVKALDKGKYDVSVVGISKKKGKWIELDSDRLPTEVDEQLGEGMSIAMGDKFVLNTLPTKFDVIFPLLHGPNGEDGSVQGLLQLLDISYVGGGVLSSAMTMDKEITKIMLRYHGIPVADWLTIKSGSIQPTFDEVAKKLGSHLFVKPANMGSSVGVSKVKNVQEWKEALEEAFRYDEKIVVEKEIKGRELECAVYGNLHPEAGSVGEVVIDKFYDYEEKYSASSIAKIQIPANIVANMRNHIQSLSKETFKVLECRGLARVDFFYTSNQEIYVNEVNSIPGFTDQSMYPLLWEDAGVSYSTLLDRLIDLALENFANKKKIKIF